MRCRRTVPASAIVASWRKLPYSDPALLSAALG